MQRLNYSDIHDAEISVQEYSSKKMIDGVKVFNLNRFSDDGGSFLEIIRLNRGEGISKDPVSVGGEPFEIRQINHSYVEPGVIKAWHLHFNQEDLWFVPPRDRLLVGLYDLRKNSPTSNEEMRLVLGEGSAKLLLIPRGVLHGLANPYDRAMQLIYLVNQEFDPVNPDEHRVRWSDFVGEEFWEIQKG